MRILYAATKCPLPPTNGQAMRTLALVRGLADLGHEIHFAGFGPESGADGGDGLAAWCSQAVWAAAGKSGRNVASASGAAGRLLCALTGRSYSVGRFHSPELRAVMARLWHSQPFDLVVADSLYALANLPAAAAPLVLNCHNVEHLIYSRFSGLNPGIAKRWYAGREGAAVRRVEVNALRRARLALACSETDQTALAALGGGVELAVVPNVVDVDRVPPPPPPPQSRSLLFLGSMDWYPNRDGVEFFAEEILPRIQAEEPAAKLVVAGRNPPRALVEQLGRRPGVEFTGAVPDMAPYLQAAAVVVVPLRLGSGTRIKILEACAAHRAVVATTVGAEGLGLRDREEILIADTAADFGDRVVRLLRRPEERDAIAAAGHAAIEQRYSRAALRASLQAALSPWTAPAPAAQAAGIGAWA